MGERRRVSETLYLEEVWRRRQAAAEADRLRAELEQSRKARAGASAAVKARTAERDRYREALREIEEAANRGGWIEKTARAALEGSEEPDFLDEVIAERLALVSEIARLRAENGRLRYREALEQIAECPECDLCREGARAALEGSEDE